MLEGYGLTETSCVVCMTPPGDPLVGHVGPPSPACEIKLDDIPEMGYTNADTPCPRGEVCGGGGGGWRAWAPHPATSSTLRCLAASRVTRCLVGRCPPPARVPACLPLLGWLQICVRGPIVFQGYYKDEANTRDTIDRDGWLHTGGRAGAGWQSAPQWR